MPRDIAVSLHMNEQLRDDLERLMIVHGNTSLNSFCVDIIERHVYGQTRTLNLMRDSRQNTRHDDAE